MKHSNADLSLSPRRGGLLMNRRGVLIGAGAGAFAAVATRPAHAVLRLDITQGNFQPMPIALPDFLAGAPGEEETARNITSVITADLQRSGLFAPINPAAFTEKITNTDRVPRFADWRVINAQALVTGRITRQHDGRLKAEFRLWDVFAGQQLDGKQYFTTPDNWRRIAHIIADAIYQTLTGEKGYFDTRIVFIDETGPKQKRIKRLAIMDQDGYGVRFLTRGDDLVLTPRFNPTSQEVTYMSYGQGQPRVYLLNIETGQREIVGNFPGMSFAPRFSPDGQKVIMSLQQGAQRQPVRHGPALEDHHAAHRHAGDRYRAVLFARRPVDLFRERPRRLAADLCDVGGGRAAKRISFGQGRHAGPVWSPRGDYIAFTGLNGSQFSIGILKPDGSGERILTEGFHNEGPTFAPNGRVIMFFRDIGQGPFLHTIDITGRNELKVPTPDFASDPAWSPLLS